MSLSDEGHSDADPSALEISSALSLILAALPQLTKTELLPLSEAFGRVISTDIHSPTAIPAFRNSAMDGFAIRFSERNDALRIEASSLAGHASGDQLSPGCCQIITTGARVPDDADTVVQLENVSREGDMITIAVMPDKGLHVRAIGSDSAPGQLLLQTGTRLRAAEVAILAAHGLQTVTVLRQLLIGVFSTGDELVNASEKPGRDQIHDANRPLLIALFNDPAMQLVDLGICPDSPTALNKLLDDASTPNVLISSGGVSVGEADHVRQVLEQRGQLTLWKIAMKPGRPLAFGLLHNGQVWFGLPGNPVSAALTSLIFVQPALRKMLGLAESRLPTVTAIVDSKLEKRAGRVEYQRGVLSQDDKGVWHVSTTGDQDSHVLTSLSKADCLIELALNSRGVKPGEQVVVHPFCHFAESTL
ncbi:MAG: gephyrin-like molybdotransferase Glp [Granulosicoccus sp.]